MDDVQYQVSRVKDYYGSDAYIGHDERINFGRTVVTVTYPVETLLEKIPIEGAEIDVAAQVEAIKWLQGQTDNEFVRAWLVQKRGLVEAAGGVKA